MARELGLGDKDGGSMKIKRDKATLCVVIGCISALGASGLRAQQNASVGASVSDSSGELQEIIVSARKHDESILNVPEIVVAIPRAKLEAMQTVDFTDLPSFVPGLLFGQSAGATGTQVSIRGIGTSAFDQGIDQSVTLNIDGLSPGTALAFQSGMFDLAQVEVLKGPQALFFGKSSTGGVISLRTADPTNDVEIIGVTSYETVARTPREEAIISGPVTDTLKARLAAMYQTSEGFFQNTGVAAPGFGGVTPTDPRSPNTYNYIIRGTVLWDPTDQIDTRLKLNLVHDHTTTPNLVQLSDCPEGTNFAPSGIPFIGNDPCQINKNYREVWMNAADYPGIINNGVPFMDNQQEFATLEVNYRPTRNLTITSVTADYLMLSNSVISGDASTEAGPAITSENFFSRREVTEEARVNSEFQSPVNFTAGLFYEDGHIQEIASLPANTAIGLPPNFGIASMPIDITTYSVFGQVRWDILPRLELAAGLRWSDETRTEYPVNGINLVYPQLGYGAPIPVLQPRIHADNNSPEVTLTYRPTDDLTTYAAYKTGFKSGSFSIATPPNPGTNNAFGEETVKGGETGVKSRWLDRHLTADITAYIYDYSGLQVGAIAPAVDGQNILQTLNAGAARIYGLDFDATYRPIQFEGLAINAAVDWNHARYETLDNVPCWGGQTIVLGCNQLFSAATGLYTAQNLNGAPMLRAPTWQTQLGISHDFALPNGYELTLSNNNAFTSRYVTFLAVGRPNNDDYQGSFVKSDLSLSLRGRGGAWELALIGKDLNNRITTGNCQPANFANGVVLGGQVTGGTTSGPAGLSETECWVDGGRQVWLRLTVRPFASHN